jgi:hypothetical protein
MSWFAKILARYGVGAFYVLYEERTKQNHLLAHPSTEAISTLGLRRRQILLKVGRPCLILDEVQ